jgi:hypothetical protein
LFLETAEGKIRRMAIGLTRLAFRLALILCGLISLSLSRAFRSFQGVMPDADVKWPEFSIALMLIGGAAVVIALLPSSWRDKLCKIDPDTQDRSSIPIKPLACFAGFSYLLTVGLNFAPLNWHLTKQAAFLLCPACVLTITVDPSFRAVLLVLAPLNAAVFGSLGAILGCCYLAVRNRLT